MKMKSILLCALALGGVCAFGGGAKETAKQKPGKNVVAQKLRKCDFLLNRNFKKDAKFYLCLFSASWCPPCRAEMPEIQEIYEEYGENAEDVIILGIASPNVGREGSTDDISDFLEENGYTYPVVMDTDGVMASTYGINAFPTTFMIDKDGNIFGYVSGQLTKDIMKSIISQTMEGVRAANQ